MRALALVLLLCACGEADAQSSGPMQRLLKNRTSVANLSGVVVDRFLPTGTASPGGDCSGTAATMASGAALTFTAASTVRTCQKNDGTVVTMPTGVQRITTVFTGGTSAMLMTERAATNSLHYGRDWSNPVWTATNMSCVLNATGLTGVSNSASSCTATAANATVLQSLVQASAVRASGFDILRVTGTGEIDITRDNGGTWTVLDASTCAAKDGTGTAINSTDWVRCQYVGPTISNPTIGLRIVTNGDAIRVDFGQNESGNALSSRIATAAVDVTRSSETARIDNPLTASAYLNSFCLSASVFDFGYPGGSRDIIGLYGIGGGSFGAANTMSFRGGLGDPTSVDVQHFDSAAALKVRVTSTSTTFVPRVVTAWRYCQTGSALTGTIYKNGTAQGMSSSGSGAGTFTAASPYLFIGSGAAGSGNSAVGNVCVGAQESCT